MNKIDLEFRKRFVKSYNLPIQVLVSPYFEYFLDLYEEDYGSREKWDRMIKLVETEYDGKPGKLLEYYFNTKNKVISDIEGSEEYKNFCDDKTFFDRFTTPGEVKRDLYTGEQKNKLFMSIDLMRANFQTFKFYNPKLINNKDTYEDFINEYDKTGILSESKYTRQVIFGKLNVKRQVTIEKWLIYSISKELETILPNTYKLFSRQTDELIYELPTSYKTNGDFESHIINLIKTKLNLDIKIEIFNIDMIQRFTKEGISINGIIKTYLYPLKNPTIHKVPVTHFAQMFKCWKNESIDETYDLVFMHEKQLAHFDYPLFILNNND